jgi:XTP/dITP diphosphohydrolase
MTTLLIATRNAHKVGEIQAILGAQFHCLTLKEFPDAPPVIEDADTFAGNATKKAVELARWLASNNSTLKTKNSKLDFVLADDSGLEVDALNGAPGVISARYAAEPGHPNATDADNNAKLLRELDRIPDQQRTARFVCTIALARNGKTIATFRGEAPGFILRAPRGTNGFGYDPLFFFPSLNKTFAELTTDEKAQVSHRGQAFRKLLDWTRAATR